MKQAKQAKQAASRPLTNDWRPPKPLVGQRILEKVLNRHTAVRCPESRLVVAVISVAIVDCLCQSSRRLRRQARHFILGTDLQTWCDWVGLNPDFVRRIARQAGYLADQAPQHKRAPAKAPTQPPSETIPPNTQGAHA